MTARIGPLAHAAVLGAFVKWAEDRGLNMLCEAEATSPPRTFHSLETEDRWLAFRGAIEAFAWRIEMSDGDAKKWRDFATNEHKTCSGCELTLSALDAGIVGCGCVGCYAALAVAREALQSIALMGMTLPAACGEMSRESFYYDQLCKAIATAEHAKCAIKGGQNEHA